MHRALFVIAFVALFALSLNACTKSEQEQAQQQIQNQAGDAWTCTQVRAGATELDPATVSLVKISCAGGVVTMQGQVRSAQERAQLINIARKVKDVRRVKSEIAVNPKAPTGNEIADDVALAARVQVALAGQTGVNAFEIGVSAHRGIVTLTGTVPTRSVKTVALDTARSVSGVKGIVDKIQVHR